MLAWKLTADDFRRVARQPVTVVAATAGQFVLLPVIGWLLVRSRHLQPAIAQGVLLVAACPRGAMANVYAYLARANVALSETLHDPGNKPVTPETSHWLGITVVAARLSHCLVDRDMATPPATRIRHRN